MYYSLIGLLASLVLVITNHDVLMKRPAGPVSGPQKIHRRFLLGIMAYYVTDMLWGVLDALSLTTALFIDTEIYYIAMGLGIMFWTEYVVAYLEETSVYSEILRHAGRVMLGLELLLTVTNLFRPVLFHFDELGAYHAGPARHVMLLVQIMIHLLTSGYALRVTSRVLGPARKRHLTIGLVGLVMVITLSIQLFYPLLPLYTIGYMLGSCILRTFVIENEKEEYRTSLEAALSREQQQRQELSSAWKLAYTDPLTGVRSKLAYAEREERMENAIAAGTAGPFAVVVFDLNRLKSINDTLGHDIGDKYIKSACRLICETFQHSPVFRVGGDEFVAILEGRDYENREALLGAFDRQIEENLERGGAVVSAGIAVYIPDEDHSYERIFKRADRLMYRRKEELKAREKPLE